MPIARHWLLIALLLFVPAAAAQQFQTFEKAPLTIDTATGAQHFTVELAVTPAQQEQGLMFRRAMAADAGMLFVFPQIHTATFWMHNTFIPLDMLFVGFDGHIADIHERAVPLSDALISSKGPVLAVIELNGGTVSRLGIKPGDLVHHEAFGTAPKQ
jgi:uncharacterized membrane protein (UPF0127 family)